MAFLRAASPRTQLMIVIGVAIALTAAVVLLNLWFHSTTALPWSDIVQDPGAALGF